MRLILVSIICLFFSSSLIAQAKATHSDTKIFDAEKQIKISDRPYKEIFNPDKRFEITGKIDHYTPDSNNRFITFRTYDVAGSLRDTSISINADGSFNTTLFQQFEGDIFVMFSDGDKYLYTTHYISPGKKVNFEIDNSQLKSGETNRSLITSGKFSNTDKLISDFNSALHKQVFKTNPDWSNKQLTDEEVALLRIKRMKEELRFLNDFIIKNKISDITFENWQKNDIIYQAGYDISFYSFTFSRNRSFTYEQLIKVLKDIPLNNPGAIHNSTYYSFLNQLSSDLEIIVNVNPAYKTIRKENGNDPVPVVLQKADLYTNGIAKQLLYYDNYISHRSSQTAYYLNRYQRSITNKFLRKQLEEKAESMTKTFEAYDVIQKINEYKVDESLKKRLLNIFGKEKSNYLFVDFWGSWCGPCMLEMPVYPKFIGQFNKDSLHFLFLSYEMTEDQVIQVKNKYGIAGDFILLNNNEMKILNNVLGFESYPHHFVIDPESFVVNNNISDIESGDEPNKEVIKIVQDILAKRKE